MKSAAGYCRSSKDRSDVSIAAQKHELEALAKTRHLSICTWYEDAVYSGSTEDRPAFQRLIAAIKNRGRGWDHLLVLDTSRVARGRFIAQAFKRECARYGVTILYAKMPETDPISTVILEAVFEAMDEVHSLMSREKGLAGMAENVRAGFRAGGRAPIGYRLAHQATGAVRDGRPVMKSKLALDIDATRVGEYLKARARGTPRLVARRAHMPQVKPTSLIGVEWNALTYAGHTVWNRHHELDRHGNRTGRKRRPRDEWQIQRDTHPALISDAEAEALMIALETSARSQSVSRARRAASGYLLTDLLITTDGQRWTGQQGRWYRLRANGRRGRCLPTEDVDGPVLERVAADISAPVFAEQLVEGLRMKSAEGGDLEIVRAEIARLEAEKARASRFALQGDDGGAFFGLVQERARQIASRRAELAALQAAQEREGVLAGVTVADVRAALRRAPVRDLLPDLVSRIVLDQDLTCKIEYRPAKWLGVASPKGLAASPLYISTVEIQRRRA